MGSPKDVDRARRILLKAAVYSAPIVIDMLRIKKAQAQTASCAPSTCQPACAPNTGCSPQTCKPRGGP